MNEKREDESVTAFTVRRLRNDFLEEAARVIDEGQETHETSKHGDRYILTPRHKYNLTGLVYAAAIRALKT